MNTAHAEDDASPFSSRALRLAGILAGLCWAGGASAVNLDLGAPFGKEMTGVLNTAVSFGVGVRMEDPDAHLIGRQNLNPNICDPPYQACQGLFREQTYPAVHIGRQPGGSNNTDDGNLNYAKGDLFQAPLKITSDLTLDYGGYGLFARVLYFYDFVNNGFTEFHPNRITSENRDRVGRVGSTLPPDPDAGSERFYGPGGVVREKRTDGEVLRQVGTDFQVLDLNVFGQFAIGETDVDFKIGRQLANWGESTTLVLNSINSANPINVNNALRVGGQVEEFLTPINQVALGATLFEGFSAEVYYQLEWKPTEVYAPGSYWSDIDAGSNNAGPQSIVAGFGLAEDPECQGKLIDNALSAATATCASAFRLPDWEPKTSGQYGIKFDYYAPDLFEGTSIGLSYQNYHSRLPYVSLFSAYPSCARKEGNAMGTDATTLNETLLACPDLPLTHAGDDRGATSSVLQLETARYLLEYPEDIHLLGISGNTTAFDYSWQVEIAYRPDKPIQVDVLDLSFAALGNQGWACGQPGVNCTGSNAGTGFGPDGDTATYGSSDFVDATGANPFPDTIDLSVGHVSGAQRNFPNFVIPYRGGVAGQNAPCYPVPGSAEDAKYGLDGFDHPYYPYDRNSPCYIRGYDYFDDYQFNLGATKVIPASDNWIFADQVILVYEVGAEWVPELPAYDQLVLQAPGVVWGATAGADGSGADGSRMACSNIPNCSHGPDGLRFNPHQQDHDAYPDEWSWGYRILVLPTYEQIITGITLKPFLFFGHDVMGTSPGPAGNFIKDRKFLHSTFEFRYHQELSLTLGYSWLWGGDPYNSWADRDLAQAVVRYQF